MPRKVIYGVGISLDGYIARKDGTFDFLRSPKGHDFAAFFKMVDVALMGRKTYDVMRRHGGKGYPGMKNYVFSRKKRPGVRGGLEFTRENPVTLVRALKKQKGKHIYLSGGSTLARVLFQAGAIDEIHLGVMPVIIGSGIPAFLGPFPDVQLEIAKCKRFPGGILELIYKVRPERKKPRNPKARR